MIKIKVDNPSTIEKIHLEHFKPIVLTKLYSEIIKARRENNKSLLGILYYLKANVDTILIGKKPELKELITKVEKYHYISLNKFSGIREQRIKEANGKQSPEVFKLLLQKFINKGFYPLRIHFEREGFIKEDPPNSVDSFKEVLVILEEKWKEHKEVLTRIFDYEAFSSAKKGWSAYELAELLNVRVCPYCNRMFTITIRKVNGEGNQTRPDFDHYYPKSSYQYLGLSLYNLIPSCLVCNRTMKGVNDFYKNEAIHPYEEEFLKVASFSTVLQDEDDESYKFLLGQSSNFNITFKIDTKDDDFKKRVQRSIEVFDIEKIYNSHKDVVLDIIRTARVYTDERFKELYDQVRYMYDSDEEFMQSFFLNYMATEDQDKRPFAKLTQDISKELGLSLKFSKRKETK
ncbi:hypothetical protein O0Q50_23795 [Priestia aryabhattai]|uniref:HNH endonuclease n=1 Tax=Priestia aryabhattai TaxID=412384 RepID=A0AAX6NE67_PRIAR|nr:hypothetical protein [Priestia aryabhattai]MDU9694213.1 hypothetical protein [Priestia aryabhattai]